VRFSDRLTQAQKDEAYDKIEVRQQRLYDRLNRAYLQAMAGTR
jgi:hypothetical protein